VVEYRGRELFSTEGEVVRANGEKKQFDWLATNTDVITTQSHSLLLVRGTWKTRVNGVTLVIIQN
jgi:hypothetical protein